MSVGQREPRTGPRTGAFASVRARWLLLWVVVGFLGMGVLAAGVASVFGVDLTDEALGIVLYLPMIGWIAYVVIRHGIDLRIPLRWPRLGGYWWVVVGMFFVQLLFSMGSSIVTSLLVPWLGEGQEDVGQGNLLLALVALVILPPLVEEVLFRFVLLERFAVKWRIRVAIVVTAVAFGILHADPVGAGAFGVVTALLYLRTRSLWPGILVHAANNLLAVGAAQLAGAGGDAEAPTATLLLTAAVLVAISAPFLVWFVVRHWPARNAPTPYQRYEAEELPPSSEVLAVTWSAAPGYLLALTAEPTQLSLAHSPSQPPMAVLPLHLISAVYPSAGPAGEQVVILLHDGTWTTVQTQGGYPPANHDLARFIGERAGLVALTSTAPAPVPPW